MKSVAVLPALTVRPGETQPRVSSLQIAEAFDKDHRNVVQSIRKLSAGLPSDFNALNFKPVDYLDAKGETRPAYLLTRDAFSLLAMGFTGQRAILWKIRFIAAFNEMEARLNEPLRLTPGREAALIRRGLGFARRLTPARRREIRAAARYAALGLGYAEIGRLLGCGAEKARNLQREGAWLKGGAPVMNAPTTSFPRRAAAHAGISLPRKGGAQ